MTELTSDLREAGGSVEPPAQGLIVPNLLLDFAEIAALFRAQVDACGSRRQSEGGEEPVLDAFLLGAGANQLLEDYLHRDLLGIAKVADYLRSRGWPKAATVPHALLRAGASLRSASLVERRLRRRQRALADILDGLAGAIARSGSEWRPAPADLDAVRGLDARLPRSLRRSILRLPNCFVSFDQRPEDCSRLAVRLATRLGDSERPVCVLGLRTSGSYLAPLTAAYLRGLGFARVESITIRPGQLWWRAERHRLLGALGENGIVALVDDPPRTGQHLVDAAAEIQALGVPRSSIVFLLQTQGELPAALREYATVVLDDEGWSVHDHLRPDSIGRALRDAGWEGTLEVEAVERWSGRRSRTGRGGHVAGLFRVRSNGSESAVFARGVGLGYFGRRALAGMEANEGLLPRVHALTADVLLREWLPEEDRLGPGRPFPGDELARTIAGYAVRRSRALRVAEDVSMRLVGREALWQHVASMLGEAYGKLRLPLRPVLHQVARHLTRPATPSVPDGGSRLTSWFAGADEPAAIRKIDFEEGGFRAAGGPLYNFDSIFDLASAAVETDAAGEPGFAESLRRHYEELTNTSVPPERWLLYRLLLLGADRREAAVDGSSPLLALERALARVHREYIEELLFADLNRPTGGDLCAVDIDGVLEAYWLSHPGIGPAGAQALRSLVRHGFRPVLVTGRSVADVRERCAAYRLAGGVAEYGAALYVAEADETVSLLDEAARAELRALRVALERNPGVFVDPEYRHGVRVYRADRLRGIDKETADRVLVEAGVDEAVRVVHGIRQTDFVAADVDKGVGLRALARHLGSVPVALAVGDSESDLAMLEVAGRAAAPANADAAVRRAARAGRIDLQRQPYEDGLLSAVASFIGHDPRRCSVCGPPVLGREARLLMTVLAAHDAGRGRKVLRSLELAARAVRRS